MRDVVDKQFESSMIQLLHDTSTPYNKYTFVSIIVSYFETASTKLIEQWKKSSVENEKDEN